MLFESEGIYCVEDDDCFFYVDSTGSAVSEKYHDLNPFINGVCRAQRSDLEWVNINRQDLKV